VGKTVLTAAWLAAARAAGEDAAPMKPVQTGALKTEGEWRSPDLDFCLRIAGMAEDPDGYRHMAPYCFRPACSPHLAAREAGVGIELAVIRQAYEAVQAVHASVLVEGAGGVRVPLDDRRTMLDLMVELALPVLVAASPRLGTINHTLLALDAIRSAGLTAAGVVLVETEPGPWGTIERDSADIIQGMSGIPLLGSIPFLGDLDTGETARQSLVFHAAALKRAARTD
jgi:dethiobiotin synthase